MPKISNRPSEFSCERDWPVGPWSGVDDSSRLQLLCRAGSALPAFAVHKAQLRDLVAIMADRTTCIGIGRSRLPTSKTAELLFTRYAVTVTIHLGARAMSHDEFGLFA